MAEIFCCQVWPYGQGNGMHFLCQVLGVEQSNGVWWQICGSCFGELFGDNLFHDAFLKLPGILSKGGHLADRFVFSLHGKAIWNTALVGEGGMATFLNQWHSKGSNVRSSEAVELNLSDLLCLATLWGENRLATCTPLKALGMCHSLK